MVVQISVKSQVDLSVKAKLIVEFPESTINKPDIGYIAPDGTIIEGGWRGREISRGSTQPLLNDFFRDKLLKRKKILKILELR